MRGAGWRRQTEAGRRAAVCGRCRPCYAPAGYVLVDRSGGTLRFSCAEHLEHWRERIRVPYRVLTTSEWVAAGCGHRGPHLGAAGYERGDAWEG